jgi:hypothetical protein
MFNDPASSPLPPKYFAKQSTNLLGQELKNLELVDRSKWLTLYPDPWDPTRLSLVKKASKTNYWSIAVAYLKPINFLKTSLIFVNGNGFLFICAFNLLTYVKIRTSLVFLA